jgi:hypothetical protein
MFAYDFDSKSETYQQYFWVCPFCGIKASSPKGGVAALFFVEHPKLMGCIKKNKEVKGLPPTP